MKDNRRGFLKKLGLTTGAAALAPALMAEANTIREEYLHRIKEDAADKPIRLALIGAGIILIGLAGIGFLQRKKNGELARAEKDLTNTLHELTAKNEEVQKQSILLSEANTALKESNSVRERLLSVVSHDLKTPLTSLQTLLDYWDKKLLSEEELTDLLPRISKQTETVNLLLENLLEWPADFIASSHAELGLSVPGTAYLKLPIDTQSLRASVNCLR